MTERGLRVEATRYVHCTVIRASGELDHDGRVRFSACIKSVWDWSAGPVLVFDLHDLDFYDSSVIGVLAMAMQRMEEERSGGRIILVQPDHHLLSVLRLTDLLSHVELADSVEQVVAELMVQAEEESSGRAPPRVVLKGCSRDRRD
ncbi:anti-sigma factor antagonist [Nonomuraea mesophila]|uniref:Anti-sigma factor antagonist n=1 Tax=Nonomuraea mesophila TaxID=2530382 RepID=A0A4R5FL75_9ACTN|nr:STAS domain-containing protein [Nonomuraea mesophila]TDE53579.1 anti-sigma factor antagonist [Nonomuraea mesophila]